MPAALVFACCAACTREPAAPTSTPAADGAAAFELSAPPKASVELPHPVLPANMRFLAFGGGSDPLSNQISLAQDVALFKDSVPGPGMVLFASGKGAMLAVEEEPAHAQKASIGQRLARILGTPSAEFTAYKASDLAIDGPATSEHVLAALTRALSQGDAPLLVYGATHGEQGATPRDNALALWGGWELSVQTLAELLDRTEHARPTRFVLTACFGGGFADLAFVAADPKRGVRAADHCGLFAAPWDDEASGCDPSPDRRSQESFAIHFLHALHGADREQHALPASADLDGDGQIGLLDAHAWARVASHSFDIPTTTSERYLRSLAIPRSSASLNPAAAPEDAFVATALGAELGLANEREARDELRALDAIMTDVNALAEEARGEADDAFYALRIALLERWPLLNHPWEERALAVVHADEAAIAQLLEDSDLSRAQQAAAQELDTLLAQHDSVRIKRARVLRLVRAHETLRLASALKKKGGEGYRHFEALRRCERFSPAAPLAPAQPTNRVRR